MIDLHHHCLPGVDDGPKSLEAAVAQCRAAYEDGIRTVVATPHRHHPQYDAPPGAARAAHAALREACAAAGIGLDLLLGHEVHFHGEVAAGLADGSCFRLGENRRWFLLELPASHVPPHFGRMIFALHLAGHYPLLAHPERNVELRDAPEKLVDLHRQGVRTQLTAMSITGEFGRRARAASERWVKEGVADVLATDAHDTERRPPRLRAAADVVAKWAGAAAADRMVQGNPARILRGEALG